MLERAQLQGGFLGAIGRFAEGVTKAAGAVTDTANTVNGAIGAVKGAIGAVGGIVDGVKGIVSGIKGLFGGKKKSKSGANTTSAPSSPQLGAAGRVVGAAAGALGANANTPGLAQNGFIGKAVRIIKGIFGFLFGDGSSSGELGADGSCRAIECVPDVKEYEFIKITASALNPGGYPVDIIAIDTGTSEIEALSIKQEGVVTNKNGALGASTALTCGDFAVLAPGSSITANFSGASASSGSTLRLTATAAPALALQCKFAGTAKVEASTDGETWDLVSAVTLPGVSLKLPGSCDAN